MRKLYRSINSGAVYELDRIENGRAYLFPQGGGISGSMLEEDFRQNFVEHEPDLTLRHGFVTYDGLDLLVPCYLNEQRWNGWRVPRITKEMAHSLLRVAGKFEYEEATDTFHFWYEDEPDQRYEFEGDDYDTVDGVMRLYCAGDGWCWDEVKPDDCFTVMVTPSSYVPAPPVAPIVPNEPLIFNLMKEEIIEDILDGRVPMNVRTFGELHDYVDANCYGGMCDDFWVDGWIAYFGGRDADEGMPDALIDMINRLQERVDVWLKNGEHIEEMMQAARNSLHDNPFPKSWLHAVRTGMNIQSEEDEA